MYEEYLDLSEQASMRARRFLECGMPAQACEAYLTAADHMLRFADGQQGAMKTEAQLLAEQLLLKAQKAKGAAAPAAAQPAPAVVTAHAAAAPVSTPPVKAEDPARPTNRSAISRDLESYRHSTGHKMNSAAEDRLKFAPEPSPNVHFSDIAGLDNVKRLIDLKVIKPIQNPDLFKRFSKDSNGGILLYGPPGTGKTMIARAIATETGLDFFSVRCSDIVGKTFGDGERNLRALFDAARQSGRAMIFFDEFESLACKRGRSTVMNRIVPELLSQMDGFQQNEGLLIVLASTNRPWDLDSAVLRPPRLTEHIYVGLPDFPARHYMIKKALEPLPKRELLDYDHIADALEGYNCADIAAFVEKVKEGPIVRGLRDNVLEQYICLQDVEDALAQTHSSVQKSDLEAFSKWDASQQ